MNIRISPEAQQIITPQQAWHYKIIPHSKTEEEIVFFITEGQCLVIQDELEILFLQNIKFVFESEEDIERALIKYYRRNKRTTTTYDGNSNDFLPFLITDAKQLGSSDIHIEVYEERCRVRVRIDGRLVERYKIEEKDYPSLINKVKIMAGLDIAEKRLPQDGRIFFKDASTKMDIRVSVLPTLHGEKIVLRLLNNDATNIQLDSLGFEKNQLQDYIESVKKPHGIVLISGPTGSGKTTTLYATLKLLNQEHTNIVTIEDPIEYTLEGINQVQLKESIGLNFISALRSFLRQDPDVIMVGEIRDADTASMAIRASLTGHLVLSTIHTNSAWGSVSRLIDMGIPSYLVANTLNTTVAQRLVRKLCTCKEKQEFKEELYPRRFKSIKKVKSHYTAKGCEQCHYTGYKGRIALYEIIPIDSELAQCVKEKQFDVTEQLISRDISSLAQNAFNLFETGKTSLEEIYPILINF